MEIIWMHNNNLNLSENESLIPPRYQHILDAVYYLTLHTGKTTILYRLMLKEHIFTTPTLGYNSETFTPIAGSTFTMLDLGDWPKLRTRDWHHHHEAEGMQLPVQIFFLLSVRFSFVRSSVFCFLFLSSYPGGVVLHTKLIRGRGPLCSIKGRIAKSNDFLFTHSKQINLFNLV